MAVEEAIDAVGMELQRLGAIRGLLFGPGRETSVL